MIFPNRLIAAALAFSSAATLAATPSHLYELNDSLADSLGGPSLTSYGGSFTPSTYTFDANQGLSLSNVLGNVYTIDTVMALNEITGYRKLIDFKALASDNGLYNLNSTLAFYATAFPASSVFAADRWAQVTLTRDAAGITTGYVNGVQLLQFDDSSSEVATFSETETIAHFFMDDFAVPGEASGGRVDYIAIYDSALSAAEVSLITTVPEPESYALMLVGLAGLALWAKRRAG